jgi:hypothetical protein
MPALSKTAAAEKLAHVVEKAKPSDLQEIYTELFPDKHSQVPLVASEIAKHVRSGLEAEEIVRMSSKRPIRIIFTATRRSFLRS